MRKVNIANEILIPEVIRLLDQGKSVTLRARGNSMLPFITGDRDSVVLSRQNRPAQVGDIVLADLGERHYVIHRIYAIKGNQVTLMGDGNIRGTEQCAMDDIIGQVIQVVRKGKNIRCDSTTERLGAKLWKWLLPCRRYLLAIYRRIN